VERLLRRDRTAAAIALLAATALAWAALFRMRSGMASMDGAGMAMPGMQTWSPVEPLLLFLMWATMMVAMMLPSAAPTILLVASVLRRRREHAPSGGGAHPRSPGPGRAARWCRPVPGRPGGRPRA